MPTIYASPGYVLRMQTMNGHIIEFKEVSLQRALNDLHRMIEDIGEAVTFDIIATTAKPKVSDSNQNQIILMWKGENEAAYEVIYEWLVKKQ